jgi:hypothetical protein
MLKSPKRSLIFDLSLHGSSPRRCSQHSSRYMPDKIATVDPEVIAAMT